MDLDAYQAAVRRADAVQTWPEASVRRLEALARVCGLVLKRMADAGGIDRVAPGLYQVAGARDTEEAR